MSEHDKHVYLPENHPPTPTTERAESETSWEGYSPEILDAVLDP